jgi:hypothetical protein
MEAHRASRQAVIGMVTDGELDDALDILIDAIVARRRQMDIESALGFDSGDHVKFDVTQNEVDDVWRGIDGYIDSIDNRNGKITVRVNVPERYRKYKRRSIGDGQQWTVPGRWIIPYED